MEQEKEEGMGDMVSRELTKLLEENGDTVGHESTDCDIHRLGHADCVGCKHHLGCAKLSTLIRLLKLSMSYQPKDFEDMIQMERTSAQMRDKVLQAKTVDEAHSVIS